MRTTVTLDPDVRQLLQRAMQERGLSFKDAVNEAIRSGLRPYKVPAFRQRTYSMGMQKINLDKTLQIASELEDQEILRKMREGK